MSIQDVIVIDQMLEPLPLDTPYADIAKWIGEIVKPDTPSVEVALFVGEALTKFRTRQLRALGWE